MSTIFQASLFDNIARNTWSRVLIWSKIDWWCHNALIDALEWKQETILALAYEQCQCNHWLQYTREYMYSKHCTTVYSVTLSHIILYKLLVKSYIWCSKTRIWIFSYIKRRMCVLFSWPSWRLLACLIIYILFLWENRHRNKINKKNIYIWLIQSGATASSPYTKGCMVQYNEKYKTLTAI